MKILPLREQSQLAAHFVAAFEAEWPDWYGSGGQGDAAQDLAAFANSEGSLPVGVVAIDADGRACGLAALKVEGIAEFPNLGPWAGAGYVVPEMRGRGVGAELLRSLLGEARRLGHSEVYCATSTSRSLLERSGWQLLAETAHQGRSLAVFKSAA